MNSKHCVTCKITCNCNTKRPSKSKQFITHGTWQIFFSAVGEGGACTEKQYSPLFIIGKYVAS